MSAWRAPGVVAISVALQLGLTRAPLGEGARVALTLLLGALAVGVSLAEAMGLRQAPRAVRAIILVPVGFCVVACVVLVLEAAFRARLVLW